MNNKTDEMATSLEAITKAALEAVRSPEQPPADTPRRPNSGAPAPTRCPVGRKYTPTLEKIVFWGGGHLESNIQRGSIVTRWRPRRIVRNMNTSLSRMTAVHDKTVYPTVEMAEYADALTIMFSRAMGDVALMAGRHHPDDLAGLDEAMKKIARMADKHERNF